MFTFWSNSIITILAFSLDVDDTFLTPLTVDTTCSIGFVTDISTFSGLAPGYCVSTIAYGRSILGNKSVFISKKDTIPSINTITTATATVNGLLTLYLGIISSPSYH